MQQQHPCSEKVWSLPADGGTKFRQDRAVRGRSNGVVTLLEFGEQYALAIPEHRKQDFPGQWCHFKLLVRLGRGMFPLHGGTLRLELIMVHQNSSPVTIRESMSSASSWWRWILCNDKPILWLCVVVSADVAPRGSTLFGSLAAHASCCKSGHVNNK